MLYLIRLSAYENEQMESFGLESIQRSFISFSHRQSKNFGSSGKMPKKQGLWSEDVTRIVQKQKSQNSLAISQQESIDMSKVDSEVEINAMHGLRHLAASDEELSFLFHQN